MHSMQCLSSCLHVCVPIVFCSHFYFSVDDCCFFFLSFHGISCHCHTIAARFFPFVSLRHDERMHFVHECNQKWHWNFETQMSWLVLGRPPIAVKLFRKKKNCTRDRIGGLEYAWEAVAGSWLDYCCLTVGKVAWARENLGDFICQSPLLWRREWGT